jgi:hypothetical protein
MSWLGFAAALAWTIMVRSIPEPPDAPLTNLQLTRPKRQPAGVRHGFSRGVKAHRAPFV